MSNVKADIPYSSQCGIIISQRLSNIGPTILCYLEFHLMRFSNDKYKYNLLFYELSLFDSI